LVGLAFALLPTASTRAQPDEISPGAARLLRFESVTVVYPAGPGEDVETNRISAQRRARFLIESREIAAEAVADNAATTEQLAGNLLLLGWGNRLLNAPDSPAPIVRKPNGWTFLDEIEFRSDEDLLFSARSPHSPDGYVVFWSRIDLEIDRLRVLPFLGSDFAVYHDYALLYQGMFKDPDRWPPERNPAAERDRRLELRAAPVGRSSDHYDLHYFPGQMSYDETHRILSARETAFGQAAARIGDPPDDFRIQLFVYADAEAKQEKTGSPDPAHAIGERSELHMTLPVARSPNHHEDAHLVARAVLGPSYLSALYEGLAVDVEQPAGGEELQVAAAVLLQNDALPTIDELLDEEAFRPLAKQRIGFPSAGLLVRWLRESTDAATLRKVYGWKEGSLGDLAAAVGRPDDATETAFRVWVAEQADGAKTALAYRSAWAEARQLREQGDFAGAAAALSRALEAKPEDFETLFALARAQNLAGEPETAEGNLRRLLEAEPTGPFEYLRSFAHFQLGQALDLQDRRAEARYEYERVLALPDRRGIHSRARAAMATADGDAATPVPSP
jgi:hypothetical protein